MLKDAVDSQSNFQIVFVDQNKNVCKAFQHAFARWNKDVCVLHDDIRNQQADALLSPANSFGIMDGGIDKVISHWLPGLQSRVSHHIKTQFLGFQPVGTAMILETGQENPRYLLHAPTMRVPGKLLGESQYNLFSAFWAALLALEAHNQEGQSHIKNIIVPGLGTGVGCVEPQRASALCELAYRKYRLSFLQASPDMKSAWEFEAQMREAF